ncbi:MAG: MBOAT family protein [Ruminococcus sp.]|nr:MBOAT family protein [Ruminococcus sp.]
MVFSSSIFLWCFLPLVFVINYFIQAKWSNAFLLIASLIFYAWGEPYLVFLMILMILLNWLVGLGIDRFAYKKVILIFGIVFDLGILGYYKYAAFVVEILNNLMRGGMFPAPAIRLPIGISFFTFQAISYIVDVYRKETKAQKKIVNVALYISFFPQLIAGPIVKYRDINEQIENRIITGEGIAEGFRRFIYGLSKKVLISNVLGKSADSIFALDITAVNGGLAWVAALFYTFQIYYDFSGYSDMAIGLGRMFGFHIPENFNYPYLSLSIQEFWRRWHISLSSWFKEYIYIPLGGNRKGKIRTYVNLFVVFFLTGLWHGASYSFIIWGLYHGFFSIIERLGFKKILDRNKFVSWIYCFLVVNFGWVIFRMNYLKKALRFIVRMLMPWRYYGKGASIWEYVSIQAVFIFICALAGSGLLQKVFSGKTADWWKYSKTEFIYCAIMLILCIAAIVSDTYNPFIYFQF